VVWYAPPLQSHFFPELLNLLHVTGDNTSLMLYSEFDQLALARILGAAQASKLLSSPQTTFLLT
jgi:hypothetical protein